MQCAGAARHAADLVQQQQLSSRAVFEPRAVLKEFGPELSDTVTVRVQDLNANMRYVVIQMRPPGTAGWSVNRLASVLPRETLVGATVPRAEG